MLVISTIDTESVWADKIRKIDGADFVENKKLLIHVPDEKMRFVFWMRVVQYWNIERITTINAEFGYKLINSYRRQLKDLNCKCYVHAYAFDITEDGYIFNYIPNGLIELYGAVKSYITDSKYYADLLCKIHGFNASEVKTLYSPVDVTKLAPKKNYQRKNRIIYAARICNQKIADVAVEVGRQLGEQGIELHFYGSIDPEYAENDRFLNMIKDIPTIKYKGVFNGFNKLPLDDYDMLLLTTRTEGLAIAIIEACLSEIFVVSVAVGGLPECVKNHKNGYLIPDTTEKFNPQAYVKAILRAYETGECFNKRKIHAECERVGFNHSPAQYQENVRQIVG